MYPVKKWVFNLCKASKISFWSKKSFCLARFYQRKMSQNPICKSFSLQYWRKLCVSVFWRCFMGQIPIIWWATVIFFSLRRFFNQFIIIPEKRTEHFRWKSGELTPKCVLVVASCFLSIFGVKCPINDGWHPFFFLQIIFLTDSEEFCGERDISGWNKGNLSLNRGPLKKRI